MSGIWNKHIVFPFPVIPLHQLKIALYCCCMSGRSSCYFFALRKKKKRVLNPQKQLFLSGLAFNLWFWGPLVNISHHKKTLGTTLSSWRQLKLNLYDLKPKYLFRAEGFRAVIVHMWAGKELKAKDTSTSAAAFWLTYSDKGCWKASKHIPQ